MVLLIRWIQIRCGSDQRSSFRLRRCTLIVIGQNFQFGADILKFRVKCGTTLNGRAMKRSRIVRGRQKKTWSNLYTSTSMKFPQPLTRVLEALARFSRNIGVNCPAASQYLVLRNPPRNGVAKAQEVNSRKPPNDQNKVNPVGRVMAH